MLTWLAPALAAPLVFSADDGQVGFHAVASLHEFDGRAGDFRGDFDPATGKGSVVVTAASLRTGLGPRDSRMLYTCLDVVAFPDIRFDADGLAEAAPVLTAGAGSGRVLLEGRLRIRDVVQTVRIPVIVAWEGENLRVTGALTVPWADFGIPDPSILISSMRPDVDVRFNLLGHPK